MSRHDNLGHAYRPENSIEKMNAAKVAATRARSAWLLDLYRDENLTFGDLVAEAVTPAGVPLRKIRLNQALQAASGAPGHQVRKILARTLRLLRSTDDVDKINLDWLLDAHARGRRLYALADSLDASRCETPWPGFPYTYPPPQLHE